MISLKGLFIRSSERIKLAYITLTSSVNLDAISSLILTAIQSNEKGIANGVVPLNASSKIDSGYLYSYVDDVEEYTNLSSFPLLGESGKIYVAIDSNKIYRWSGSLYIEIGAQITLLSWSITGGRNSIGLLDRDMEIASVLTSNVPYKIPFDCLLKKFSASTNSANTWEAHVYKNSTPLTYISIISDTKSFSPDLNIPLNLGDEIRLLQLNASDEVTHPRITIYLQQI